MGLRLLVRRRLVRAHMQGSPNRTETTLMHRSIKIICAAVRLGTSEFSLPPIVSGFRRFRGFRRFSGGYPAAWQPAPLGALVLGGMSVPESAEAPSTRAGPGRWTTVLWLAAGYIPGHSRCVRGVCFKRNETKRNEGLVTVYAQHGRMARSRGAAKNNLSYF